MKLVIKTSLFCLVFVVTITSCSKKQTIANYLPKNAIVSGGISIANLEKKLLDDSTTFNNMLKGLQSGTTDSTLQKTFEDYTKAKAAGLNLSEKIYFSLLPTKTGGDFISIVIGVNNRKKAEAYIASNPNSTLKQSINNKLTVFKTTDNKFIIIGDNTLIIALPNSGVLSPTFEADIVALFNLKAEASMASVKHFDELDKLNTDGFLYSTVANAVKNVKKIMGLGKTKELLDNLETGATFNFEQGKVAFNTISWPNEKLATIFTKNAGPVIDNAIVEKFPVKVLNGFLQVNFKPQLLIDILSQADVTDLASAGGKAQIGIDPIDINKAFAGQINIMVGDIKEAQPTPADGLGGSLADGITALAEIPVADKVAFKKIMDTLVARNILFIDGNKNYVTPFNADPSSDLGISITDTKIILASNKSLLTTYQTGTASALPAAVKAKVANSSTALYIDGKSFVSRFLPLNNSGDLAAKNEATKIIKDVFLTIGNFKDNALKGNIEINLQNDKLNALPAILNAAINYFTIAQKAAPVKIISTPN